LAFNQRLSGPSTTATPAAKTRSPTTLDQTNLAREGGGGTDGGSSRSGGFQSRLMHRRRKVSPLGNARYTLSRRRQPAFTASCHAKVSDGFCLFGVRQRGNAIILLIARVIGHHQTGSRFGNDKDPYVRVWFSLIFPPDRFACGRATLGTTHSSSLVRVRRASFECGNRGTGPRPCRAPWSRTPYESSFLG
jgi:hypothetical protein